jgi:MFS family permease
MAITGYGFALHMALFPIFGHFMIETFDWRMAWMIYGLFALFVLLPAFYLLFRRHDSTTHTAWKASMAASEASGDANLIRQWTRTEVLKDWRFYVLTAVMIVEPCFNTAIFYYQAEIGEHKGLDPLAIVSAFQVLMLASVCTSYVAGSLLDKFGEKYILLTLPLVYMTGLLCIVFIEGIASIYIGMVFMGISLGAMSVVGGPVIAKLYGTKNLGSIKTTLGTFFVLSTSISPILVGFCLDHGAVMTQILTGFALYAFLAWALLATTMRKELD